MRKKNNIKTTSLKMAMSQKTTTVKKLVGLVLLVGLCVNTWAYNPQITNYEVKNINDTWLMEISFPQAAIYAILTEKYGDQIAKDFTEKEYEEKLIAYAKANTTIYFNNKKVDLEAATLRWNSHYTDVKFTLAPTASKVEKMLLRLEALSENPGQKNVLRISNGDKKDKFTLSEANDFSVQIAFSKTGISKISPPLFKKDPFLLMIVVFGMCVMAILFWFKAFDGLNVLRLTVAIILLLTIGFRYQKDGYGPVFSAEASSLSDDAIAKGGTNEMSFAIAGTKLIQKENYPRNAKKIVIIEK